MCVAPLPVPAASSEATETRETAVGAELIDRRRTASGCRARKDSFRKEGAAAAGESVPYEPAPAPASVLRVEAGECCCIESNGGGI